METPAQELEHLKKLLAEGKQALEAGKHAEAKKLFEQAMELDPNDEHPLAQLAKVYEAMGDEDNAKNFAARAKALKQHHWEQEVEAEMRSKHDVMGETIRHEIP